MKDLKRNIEIERGRLNMTGEGFFADARRNIAQLVHDGDIKAMSVRWDAIEPPVRRTSLEKGHKAFIDSNIVGFDDPRRYGMFFPKTRVLEGSIVAVGADPQSLMGRAEKETGMMQTFFRALAYGAEENPENIVDLAKAFEALEVSVEQLRELGANDVDLLNAISSESALDKDNLRHIITRSGEQFFIPSACYSDLIEDSFEMFRAGSEMLADAKAYHAEWEEPAEDDSPDSGEPEGRLDAADPEESPEPTSPEPEPAREPEQEDTPGMTVADLVKQIRNTTREATRSRVRKRLGRVGS